MKAYPGTSWISDSLRSGTARRAVGRMRRQRTGFQSRAIETLENRMVLSGGTGTLLGSLTSTGVVTSPVVVAAQVSTPSLPGGWSSSNAQVAQLNSDVQKLATELQSLAGKSGVTIADLESLATDTQSITNTGFRFQFSTLTPVISELASAVAGGTSTAQAQSDFSALFNGSSVSSSVISTTFSDLVRTISDSHVATSDLSTVSGDESAIQTDLHNLPWGYFPLDYGLVQLATDSSISLSFPAAATDLPAIVVGPATPISFGGNSSLLGSLNDTGIVTSPIVTSTTPTATGTSATAYAHLKADIQALRTELQSLATKSGVTIADLESVSVDGQNLAQAGFHFNSSTLDPVISELATAVASGASTAHAQQDFTNLFSGTSVSTTLINTAFNDLVKTISDSKVTAGDLSTVAGDRTAIKVDNQNLPAVHGKHAHTRPVIPVRHHRIVIPIRHRYLRFLRRLHIIR